VGRHRRRAAYENAVNARSRTKPTKPAKSTFFYLDQKRVINVAEERRQSSLDDFWRTLTAEQISGIRAVTMDMWDPPKCFGLTICPERVIFLAEGGDRYRCSHHVGAMPGP